MEFTKSDCLKLLKDMKSSRTLHITETLSDPNPFDCTYIGASCFLHDGSPAVIYEERWFCGEGENAPTSHFVVFHDWVELNRGVTDLLIKNDVNDFTPLEFGSPAALEVASHILTSLALKLKLVDAVRAESRKSNHPLIGVPCIYRGMPALPFGLFTVIWPPDNNAGRFEAESHTVLGFFTLSRDVMSEERELIVEVRWEESAESGLIVSQPEWNEFVRGKSEFIKVERFENPTASSLAPIMRETRQARKAFHDVVSLLDKMLRESQRPKQVEPITQAAPVKV